MCQLDKVGNLMIQLHSVKEGVWTRESGKVGLKEVDWKHIRFCD